MPPPPVLDLDHPEVAVSLPALRNQRIDRRFVLRAQPLELCRPFRPERRGIERRLTPRARYLHQNVAAVLIAPVDDGGEGARAGGAAQQGRNPKMGGNLARHAGTFTTNTQAGARIAWVPSVSRKPFGQTSVLETAILITSPPTAEAQRIGVYVLAAIVGLLVSGAISVAKELGHERADQP